MNEDGQCGNGSTGIQWESSRVEGDRKLFKPSNIRSGDIVNEKIVSISGTSDTPMVISDKGELFLWGQCEYGQPLLSNIEILVCSYFFPTSGF